KRKRLIWRVATDAEKITRLEREIEELKAENERLRRALEEALRSAKRQAAPFSRRHPKAHPTKTRGRASILPAILRNGHNRQAHILGLLLPGACRCRSRIESEYEHPSQRARKRNGHAQ